MISPNCGDCALDDSRYKRFPEVNRTRQCPAMTLVVVAGLLEDGALVEIEATAVVPGT